MLADAAIDGRDDPFAASAGLIQPLLMQRAELTQQDGGLGRRAPAHRRVGLQDIDQAKVGGGGEASRHQRQRAARAFGSR